MMCGYATFYGKHRIIANVMSNIIMRSITSFLRQQKHHISFNRYIISILQEQDA